MSGTELFTTTMDPANRQLVQLTTEDLQNTLELYNVLMGKQPALRRDFIMKNRLSKIDDAETFDDDFEE